MNTGVRTVEELAAALRDAEEELHRSQKQTQEALERQTATAEILKVIASSPSDVQPVFDAIAESAHRLFKGRAATVTRVVGDEIRLAAFTSTGEEGNRALRDLFPRSASSAAMKTFYQPMANPMWSLPIRPGPVCMKLFATCF